jgi:hypothetical protein
MHFNAQPLQRSLRLRRKVFRIRGQHPRQTIQQQHARLARIDVAEIVRM